MADGYFPTLVSKNENANSASNVMFVNLSDGTDSLNVNADGSLNVTVTGGASNTQYAEDSSHVSGDIGTMSLAVRRDTPTSGTSADGDYATLNVDSTGRLYVNVGTVTVTATDLDIRDLTHVSDSVKLGDGTDFIAINADGSLNITDNGGSLTVDGTVAATQSGTWNIGTVATITNPVTVTATDLDIRDLNLTQDAVKISGNSTANSVSNPIFVQTVTANITGEVHAYNTAASVAGGATSNHDYTVTTAMRLKSIIVSSSGAMKVEVQTGPVGTLVSKAVGFIPKAGGSLELFFDPAIEVPTTSTGTVRLIRTNREGSSQDLYSTIIGIDA
jgi:hypothetical protein